MLTVWSAALAEEKSRSWLKYAGSCSLFDKPGERLLCLHGQTFAGDRRRGNKGKGC